MDNKRHAVIAAEKADLDADDKYTAEASEQSIQERNGEDTERERRLNTNGTGFLRLVPFLIANDS